MKDKSQDRKNDITLRYWKGEHDIGCYYNAGCKGTAGMLLDVFNKKMQEELTRRGYDIKTLRLTINKFANGEQHE